jgi:hypothetical protein
MKDDQMTDRPEDEMPNWPPADSAWRHPEGTRKHGSTGQLFEVQIGQWVRVRTGKPRLAVSNGVRQSDG